MRVIIAGEPEVFDPAAIAEAIDASGFPIHVVISESAPGIDSLPARYATSHGIPADEYLPDWESHGNSAKHQCVELMTENADALVAIWDGVNRVTRGMIETASKKGLRVYVHPTNAPRGRAR